LQPSNIFFALDGQIKIGDFGLVTDMADIPIDPLTSSNSNSSSSFSGMEYTIIGHKKHTQRVGTSLYMSPEQARGSAYNYKVDIYSLGLIFFELLNYFHTETERYKVLQDIKNEKYPSDFVDKYDEEVIIVTSDLINFRLKFYFIHATARAA
jgi:translation initiation factor 2-alpha kinase 3